MTQIEIDTMMTLQATLREIAYQEKARNEIELMKLRAMTGEIIKPEEIAALHDMVNA